MVGRKIIACILMFFICVGCFSFAGAGSGIAVAINIRENEISRKNLLKQRDILKKSLDENKSKIDEKQKYKDSLHQQIIKLSSEINSLNENITELNKKILQKENDISEKEKCIQEKFEVLKKTIASIYKAGDVHTVDIILGAHSFSDFVDKAELINKMNSHSRKIISDIENEMNLIRKEKSSIEEKRNLVSKQKAILASKQKEHTELMDENQKMIDELKITQVSVQASIDENNAEYRRMEKEAEAYYAEQARKMRENSASAVNYASGKGYVWPVPFTKRITSPYGEIRGNTTHGGIDIAAAGVHGKPVLAADSGVVYACHGGCPHDYSKFKSCGCGGGYGNYVMIDHGNGKMTIYGHLCRVNVTSKQRVARGDVIGYVGSTGWSTGPHLHFETRLFNKRYNPMSEF